MPREISAVKQGLNHLQISAATPTVPIPPRVGACLSCRTLKTKCSGDQPACTRCASHDTECVYNTDPSRRGRDLQPRQRRKVDPVPKKRKASTEFTASSSRGASASSVVPKSAGSLVSMHQPIRKQRRTSTMSKESPPKAQVANAEADDLQALVLGPSMQYFRSSWWDQLLRAYSSDPFESVRMISQDLTTFFKNAHNIFSVIHIPSFLSCIARPQTRDKMQPSLVLSCLALSSLMQSYSTISSQQKDRAMLLLKWSHAAFDASVAAQWLDVPLAQAAVFLTVFEVSPHPLQNKFRINAAMHRLDVLITALGLPTMDRDIPEASCLNTDRTSGALVQSLQGITISSPAELHLAHNQFSGVLSVYNTNDDEILSLETPAVTQLSKTKFETQPTRYSSVPPEGTDCTCHQAALASNLWKSGSDRLSVGFCSSPGWDQRWDQNEIVREEARGVIWTSMLILSGNASHKQAAQRPQPVYHMTSDSQFCVLFPGEMLHLSRGDGTSGKNTVWALQARVQLLWHACIQLHNARLPSNQCGAIAAAICMEVERISEALTRHRCGIEASQLFVARFFMQYARMSATAYYRNFVPDPYSGGMLTQRREAADWLAHMKSFVQNLRVPQNFDDVMRSIYWNPWMVWLLIDQSSRCIHLWELNPSLTSALTVAQQIQPALLESVGKFSPAPCMEGYCDSLSYRLNRAVISMNRGSPNTVSSPESMAS